MPKKEREIKCVVEFTDGAMDRITDAFVNLYYNIKNGIYEGPLLDQEKKNEETA